MSLFLRCQFLISSLMFQICRSVSFKYIGFILKYLDIIFKYQSNIFTAPRMFFSNSNINILKIGLISEYLGFFSEYLGFFSEYLGFFWISRFLFWIFRFLFWISFLNISCFIVRFLDLIFDLKFSKYTILVGSKNMRKCWVKIRWYKGEL